MTEPCGKTHLLRCPYHGWTYSLEGELKGTPDFAGVCGFEKERNGLEPLPARVWENFVWVRLAKEGPTLEDYLGADLIGQFAPLHLSKLHFFERRHYSIDCNWKVFVDNYLDGGYHVPHLHKGLNSVLDYSQYTIENGGRYCLQSSPLVSKGAERETGEVRKGGRALYYWIHPNFMVNLYEGVMDTNLVLPISVDRTEVIFDWLTDVSRRRAPQKPASIKAKSNQEDPASANPFSAADFARPCAGRLSVRREAGEHLFTPVGRGSEIGLGRRAAGSR
jgi:choline monooxygenase